MFHDVWYHVHSSPVRHTAIEGSVDLIVPVFVGYLDHACAPPQSKMEPKSWWFVYVSPFPIGYFQVPCWFQWFIPICISRCFSLVLPTTCFRNGSSLFLYIPATVDGASFTGFHVLLFFWKATTPEANTSLCQLTVGRCIFLFKSPISRCYVSFREATPLPANIYQIALHLFVWFFPSEFFCRWHAWLWRCFPCSYGISRHRCNSHVQLVGGQEIQQWSG